MLGTARNPQFTLFRRAKHMKVVALAVLTNSRWLSDSAKSDQNLSGLTLTKTQG